MTSISPCPNNPSPVPIKHQQFVSSNNSPPIINFLSSSPRNSHSPQPITPPVASPLPLRSVSVPRTRARVELHVHSDSQVAYHADTDSSGDKGKQERRVKLRRSKRVSRSFGGSDRENYGRRCSTPVQYKNVFHNKDIGVGTVTCPANSVTAALLLAHQSLKLSCPLLPMELKPPVPAPLVVEDPPSSDNASDLEEDTVRYNLDPVFLNGSSGSFGSAGSGGSSTTGGSGGGGGVSGTGSSNSLKGARSAPSTPHGVAALGSAGVALAASAHEPHSQPTSPNPHLPHTPHIPRSPSHVFAKYDKGTLRQFSCSAPIMTAQARSPEPPSPRGTEEQMPAGSSKARQKKFHRHFTQVDDEERVLNYYSCALVGDILLQGHLYITRNYFAFYSNVFGYVTKLLIPISSVLKISKEKTARIIPNAVGVTTAEDKHVFGSLLSRDSTYKLMNMVLRAATNAAAEQTLPPPRDMRPGELDASEFSGDDSSSQSGNEVTPRIPRVGVVVGPSIQQDTTDAAALPKIDIQIPQKKRTTSTVTLYNVLMLIGILMLVLLFASAGIMMYRISRIHNRYMMIMPGTHDLAYTQSTSQDIYNEILHWQSELHTKSEGAVHSYLDSNLEQIAKVRKSLEALSNLLMSTKPVGSSSNEPRSEAPQESSARGSSPS